MKLKDFYLFFFFSRTNPDLHRRTPGHVQHYSAFSCLVDCKTHQLKKKENKRLIYTRTSVNVYILQRFVLAQMNETNLMQIKTFVFSYAVVSHGYFQMEFVFYF